MNRRVIGYRPRDPFHNIAEKRLAKVFPEGRIHARVWSNHLGGNVFEWKVDVILCLGEEPRPWEPCTHYIPAFAIVKASRALYRAHCFICKQKKQSGILSWLMGGVGVLVIEGVVVDGRSSGC